MGLKNYFDSKRRLNGEQDTIAPEQVYSGIGFTYNSFVRRHYGRGMRSLMETKRGFMERWQAFAADQSGAIAVLTAYVIVALLGFAALALDIGHLVDVKAELRKASEAGALAGARALGLPVGVTSWNWNNAKNTAVSIVQKNYVDTNVLADFSDANVEVGFWEMSWTEATAPAHLLGYLDPAAYVPTNGQVAAVKVTISRTKDGSGSSAPVAASFASVWGINSMEAKASAVAMISPPTTIPYSSAFPFALPLTWVTNHWKDDPPINFDVAANQHTPLSGGQWTSFKTQENGANYIDSLILGTNHTDSITIGDQIYIQNGEKASIYNVVEANDVGQIRYVPVVPDGFANGAYTTVKAYVPFKITSVTGSGNDPTVTGHFVPGWVDPNASGSGGKYFGDLLPPRLVN
jgi:Flp pilus assembly protein TadG